MIEVHCQSCGYRFGVQDTVEGLTTECPHCGAEVAVPSMRDVELPLDNSVPPPVRYHTVAREEEKPASPSQGKAQKKPPPKK